MKNAYIYMKKKHTARDSKMGCIAFFCTHQNVVSDTSHAVLKVLGQRESCHVEDIFKMSDYQQ